jgi:hypothetical protein
MTKGRNEDHRVKKRVKKGRRGRMSEEESGHVGLEDLGRVGIPYCFAATALRHKSLLIKWAG